MFIRTERSVKEFIQFYPIVSTLIIINFALWFIVYVFPLQLGHNLFQWGAGHNLSVNLYGEYWRIVTPIFLHGGLMHTVFNSFALVLFGPALEQMLGKYKFTFAYLLAGIAGNIGTYVVNPLSQIPHIGASGAIYGLFGIYLFMSFFRKDLIDPSNSQIVTTIFFIGLVMTFVRPGINIYAHIFGFIGGFAIGPFLLRNAAPFSIYRNSSPRPRKGRDIGFDPNRWGKRKKRKRIFKVLWIILGVLVVFGLISQR